MWRVLLISSSELKNGMGLRSAVFYAALVESLFYGENAGLEGSSGCFVEGLVLSERLGVLFGVAMSLGSGLQSRAPN
ncbi:MAG: hypothetical protein AAGC74_00060 [Verrucomicrobiota bacterium]